MQKYAENELGKGIFIGILWQNWMWELWDNEIN